MKSHAAGKPRRTIWLAWGLVFAMGGASFWLAAPSVEDISFASAMFVYSGVGALILSRMRGNQIGRIFFGIGSLPILGRLGESYAEFALIQHPELPGGVPMALISGYAFPALFTLLTFLFLLFPTGRLPSRRWHWVSRAAVAAFVLSLGHLFKPGNLGDGDLPARNPLGIDALGGIFETYSNVWFLLTLGTLLVSLASVIPRYRASQGQQRQQLKWFGYGALVLAVDIVIDFVVFDTIFHIETGILAEMVSATSLAFIPVAAGIAILKYRLYDIDVVINKTVVYGGLAAFITAVYAGVVVGIGTLVGTGDKPNLGLSLAATAIVAVAFQPVRERVQRFANKLVYGERVTPYEAITGFSHRMAESLSLDSVLPQMAEAAAKGVGGTRSRVRLLLPGGGEQVVTWPDGSSENSFDRTLAVVHQGEEMGEIAVAKAPGEQINSSEEKLLTDLASQAGLAMRNLRLTAELQQKLVELQASRQRIVKAQDEERRRMERDIHDGAQQQLVSMAVKLGLVRNLLSRDADKAGVMLQELKEDASEAVETLRDLARGLFPEILTEQGLKSALESHIAKMNLNATVLGEVGRFDLQIEANVYFCIREALQNASKHAPGASIVVSLNYDVDELSFSVKDEGPGFDATKVKLGSGLQNMTDRMESLGGSLEIDNTGSGTQIVVASSPGHGTTIRGRIPLRTLVSST